jgi:hypothetical protein
VRNTRAPGGNGTRPRKAARRNGAAPHDQQRREQKTARRKHRLANESAGQRKAREDRITLRSSTGLSVLAKSFAAPAVIPRARKAVGGTTTRFTAVPCDCVPRVDHGVHWVRSRVELPSEDRKDVAA